MDDRSNPMVKAGRLVSAIEEIYATTEDFSLWVDVLDRIADFVGGKSTVLVANYVDLNTRDIRAFSRTDPAMLAEYAEHYSSQNIWAERMDGIYPSGTVGYRHLAISNRELQATEFYAGWLKPYNLGYCMGVILDIPGQPRALLTSMRSPQKGPFEQHEGQALTVLLPHLDRSLRLHGELSALRSASQGLEFALDAFDRAVVGVNAQGTILFENQTAKRLLAARDGLHVKGNRLVCDWPGPDSELQFLIHSCAAPGTEPTDPRALLIERKSGKPALRLTFLPFAKYLVDSIPDLRALIFIDDPAGEPLSRATALRILYRLSPTEVRLAVLIASGLSLAEAGDHLRISTETARFHLKSVFRKTGVSRQAQLVRLVTGLPGDVGSTRP